MPNDPLYASLFGERVRVEDMDTEKGTAVVDKGDEKKMTTLESLRATSKSVEPGITFGFNNEQATVTEVDEEKGVIGYENERGEFDMTLAESVTFDDIFKR